MKKQSYKESTIRSSMSGLRAIARKRNLPDTEDVKSYLAHAKLSENRKDKPSDDLVRFYRCLNIPFIRPRYRKVEKLPFITLEQRALSSASESLQGYMSVAITIRHGLIQSYALQTTRIVAPAAMTQQRTHSYHTYPRVP